MRNDKSDKAGMYDKRQPVMRRKGVAPSLTVVIGAPPSKPAGGLGRMREDRMREGRMEREEPSMQDMMAAIEDLSMRLAVLESMTDDRGDDD